MSVTSGYEVWNGRQGNQDIHNRINYTRTFKVFTNDPEDDANIVANWSGLPLLGQAYVTAHWTDLTSIMQKLTCSQDIEAPTHWTVTVEYSNQYDFPQGRDGSFTPGNVPNNPIMLIPEISVSTQAGTKFVEEDYSTPAKRWVNTIGEPFLPPLEIQWSMIQINLMVNKRNFNVEDGYYLADMVNSVAYLGFPARTLKIDGVNANSQYDGQIGQYWKVTYTFSLNYARWIPTKVLNTSYYGLASGASMSDATKRILFRDMHGVPLSTPTRIDVNGAALAPNASGHYIEFQLYREDNYAIWI